MRRHALAGNSSQQEEFYWVKNQLVQVGRSPIDYWVVYGAKMKKPLFKPTETPSIAFPSGK